MSCLMLSINVVRREEAGRSVGRLVRHLICTCRKSNVAFWYVCVDQPTNHTIHPIKRKKDHHHHHHHESAVRWCSLVFTIASPPPSTITTTTKREGSPSSTTGTSTIGTGSYSASTNKGIQRKSVVYRYFACADCLVNVPVVVLHFPPNL